jgi:hypothetical protein
MVNVGIFYDHLVKFMAIWYSLWSSVIFFPIWYVWIKKNLATLAVVVNQFTTLVTHFLTKSCLKRVWHGSQWEKFSPRKTLVDALEEWSNLRLRSYGS